MDYAEWKSSLRNSGYIWGFLVLFTTFDLLIDLWIIYSHNWLLVSGLVALFLAFAVASRAVRKMNMADRFMHLSNIVPDKRNN